MQCLWKDFSTNNKLKVHMMIYTGEKPHQCSTCDKYFATISILNTHLLTHRRKKPYQSELYGKSFSTSSTLKVHMDMAFPSMSQQVCV